MWMGTGEGLPYFLSSILDETSELYERIVVVVNVIVIGIPPIVAP